MDGFANERGHSASSHCDPRLAHLTAHGHWGAALVQGAVALNPAMHITFSFPFAACPGFFRDPLEGV